MKNYLLLYYWKPYGHLYYGNKNGSTSCPLFLTKEEALEGKEYLSQRKDVEDIFMGTSEELDNYLKLPRS